MFSIDTKVWKGRWSSYLPCALAETISSEDSLVSLFPEGCHNKHTHPASCKNRPDWDIVGQVSHNHQDEASLHKHSVVRPLNNDAAVLDLMILT